MAPCLMINLVTIVTHRHHQHQGVAYLLFMVHDKCSHSNSCHGNDCGNSNSCSHGNSCSMIIKSYYLDYLGTTVSSTLTWPGKSNTGDISKLHINLCVIICSNGYLLVTVMSLWMVYIYTVCGIIICR